MSEIQTGKQIFTDKVTHRAAVDHKGGIKVDGVEMLAGAPSGVPAMSITAPAQVLNGVNVMAEVASVGAASIGAPNDGRTRQFSIGNALWALRKTTNGTVTKQQIGTLT